MKDREIQLLSFDEDTFDLETHQKKAGLHAQVKSRTQRLRRRVGLYKILIMLLAFLAAYGLINLASEMILRYDYMQHHTSDYSE